MDLFPGFLAIWSKEEDIYAALEERGIVVGIKDEAIITEMIKKRRMNEKVLIAEGTPR